MLKNYLKIYEKTFARVAFSKEIKNGIYFGGSLEYANRKPLFNTTALLLPLVPLSHYFHYFNHIFPIILRHLNFHFFLIFLPEYFHQFL